MMQERGFPEASSIALSSSGLYGTTRFTSMPHELARSEEHTSELQSQSNLVCRLLLEKKKQSDRLLFNWSLVLAAPPLHGVLVVALSQCSSRTRFLQGFHERLSVTKKSGEGAASAHRE